MNVTRITHYAIAAILLVVASLSNPILADTQDLLKTLQQGGNVIAMVSGKIDTSSGIRYQNDPADCGNQTNLSDVGREQARLVGENFKNFSIPVGNVLSSQFCRCKDTARIAFGRAEVNDKLNSVLGMDGDELRSRLEFLRQMLATPPDAGTNVVLVSHRGNIRKAMSGTALIWGEVKVYRPDGAGGTEFIGRIRVDEWATLAAAAN